jgi:hypothetical protein
MAYRRGVRRAEGRRVEGRKPAKKKPQQKTVPIAKPPPGFTPSPLKKNDKDTAAEAEDGSILAQHNVVKAFVELMAAGDTSAQFGTYEMVSPSHLLWSMRQFVMQQMQHSLGAARSDDQSRVHHRCHFDSENHGRQIQIMEDGYKLHSGTRSIPAAERCVLVLIYICIMRSAGACIYYAVCIAGCRERTDHSAVE